MEAQASQLSSAVCYIYRIIIKVRRPFCLCPCGFSDLCDGSSSSLVKIEEFYDNEDL